MTPRTGRPPLENARQQTVDTRMNTEELEKLDYCCLATKMSRSEVIRAGVDNMYTSLLKADKK